MELSMGMSDDFEHAVSTIYANFHRKPLTIIIFALQIEFGSTNIRVGSSIFGFRPRKEKQ